MGGGAGICHSRSVRVHVLSIGLLAVSGCSYPYDQLERIDAPMPDVPITGCHIIDQTGCPSGACQGDVDEVGRIETSCRSGGSSNTGGWCVDRSFCGNGLACWANRDGTDDGRCFAVCFTTADCPFGTHCDATTELSASFGGRGAYPCTPDEPSP